MEQSIDRRKLTETLMTPQFLFSQATLLFSTCVELNFNRKQFDAFKVPNTDLNLTQVAGTGLLNYYLIVVCSFLDE